MKDKLSNTKNLLIAGVEFTEVSIVVTLHFHVEHFGVRCIVSAGNQSFLEEGDNILTQFIELSFNLQSVPLNQVEVL